MRRVQISQSQIKKKNDGESGVDDEHEARGQCEARGQRQVRGRRVRQTEIAIYTIFQNGKPRGWIDGTGGTLENACDFLIVLIPFLAQCYSFLLVDHFFSKTKGGRGK